MLKDLTTVLIATAIVFAVVCLVLSIFGGSDKASDQEPYPLVCRVREVNYDDNAVVFEDYNGYLWEMYGIEDWMEGDCAVLMLRPAGSQSIFDDEIISARYSAWIIGR